MSDSDSTQRMNLFVAETRQRELDRAELLAKDLEILKALQTTFNLANELDRVGCLNHHSRLVDAGYSDEVTHATRMPKEYYQNTRILIAFKTSHFPFLVFFSRVLFIA